VVRLARLFVLIGLAAVAVPLQAAAGTDVGGHLMLTPAQGVQGSHFTATFSYSGAICNRFTVDFWWDSTHLVGSGQDPSSGQSCVVSINAVVPSNDAQPGTSYTITATSRALSGASIDDGPGPTATAAYEVLHASSGATAPASQPAQPPANTSTRPSSSQSADATSAASTEDQSTTLTAGAATDTSSATSSSATSSAAPTPPAVARVPLILKTPLTPGGSGGLVASIIGLAACMAVFVGAGLAHRAGRLRLPRRA
jgi:hypothetical protein